MLDFSHRNGCLVSTIEFWPKIDGIGCANDWWHAIFKVCFCELCVSEMGEEEGEKRGRGGGERREEREEKEERWGLSLFFSTDREFFFKKLTMQIKDLQLIITLNFSIKREVKEKNKSFEYIVGFFPKLTAGGVGGMMSQSHFRAVVACVHSPLTLFFWSFKGVDYKFLKNNIAFFTLGCLWSSR